MTGERVYSKLCPTMSGYILKWLDANQFIAHITCRDGGETEMVCNRQFWEVSVI